MGMRFKGSRLNKGFAFGRVILIYSFHTWGLWVGNRIIAADGIELRGDCVHVGPFLVAYNLQLVEPLK